jgi:ornithine cyclodeaminase/alanine dehydrogenase
MGRVITEQDIAAADLPLTDIYDLVVEGFQLHGRGESECPPKVGIHPRPGAFTHAMPAYLPTKDLAGAKVVSVYPDNPARGVASTSGLILMLDPETGTVTDVLDASWVTKVRTAMVSMVDVRWLGNPDPVFGIIGATGVTGRAHLDALAATFPGSRVLVGSRSPERLSDLLRDYAGASLDIVVTAGNEGIVRECDALIVCTSHLTEPILETEWLHPGHNILNVHSRAWPPDVLARVDLVSCDDRRQVIDPQNGLVALYPGFAPDLELGKVVAGASKGRESAEQTIMSFNYGLAIFDILVADYVRTRV